MLKSINFPRSSLTFKKTSHFIGITGKYLVFLSLVSGVSMVTYAQRTPLELQCKSKAKDVAVRVYSDCMAEEQKNQLDQIQREYQEDLDLAKKKFEQKLADTQQGGSSEVSGEASAPRELEAQPSVVLKRSSSLEASKFESSKLENSKKSQKKSNNKANSKLNSSLSFPGGSSKAPPLSKLPSKATSSQRMNIYSAGESAVVESRPGSKPVIEESGGGMQRSSPLLNQSEEVHVETIDLSDMAY